MKKKILQRLRGEFDRYLKLTKKKKTESLFTFIKKVSKAFHTNVSDMTLFFFNLPSEALANSHNATVRMYVSFS